MWFPYVLTIFSSMNRLSAVLSNHLMVVKMNIEVVEPRYFAGGNHNNSHCSKSTARLPEAQAEMWVSTVRCAANVRWHKKFLKCKLGRYTIGFCKTIEVSACFWKVSDRGSDKRIQVSEMSFLRCGEGLRLLDRQRDGDKGKEGNTSN